MEWCFHHDRTVSFGPDPMSMTEPIYLNGWHGQKMMDFA
jgi:hypothetical protein